MALSENSDYHKTNLVENDDRKRDLGVPYFEHTHITTTEKTRMNNPPIQWATSQLHQRNRNVATNDLQNKNTTDCHSFKQGSRGYRLTSAMIA